MDAQSVLPLPLTVSSTENQHEAAPPSSGVEILQNPAWESKGWLIHGFSTRAGGVSRFARASRPEGDLNLGYTQCDSPQAVGTNRERFLGTLAGAAVPGLLTLKQIHSSVVRRVGRPEITERATLWGDGLVTSEAGILLGIQTADCLPVLLADRKRCAVGAFHAGWRGTLKGIVQKGVAMMMRELGCDPEEMSAAIGPGIGRCCYTVGAEIRELFAASYPYSEELFSRGDVLSLDLAEANRRQLLDAGLKPEAIFNLNACTSCRNDRFFSYRAEGGSTGRLMAVIGINQL